MTDSKQNNFSDHDHSEPRGFRLRKASFKGRGLQPSMAGASRETILELSYDRGDTGNQELQ